MLKKLTMACLASATLVVASAGAASAGEVTGNGKDTPIRSGVAKSECAFSGLNNDPDEPTRGGTQSYGQLVRQGLKPFLPSPGDACNPTRGFQPPA
jgi:hypothetical protein